MFFERLCLPEMFFHHRYSSVSLCRYRTRSVILLIEGLFSTSTSRPRGNFNSLALLFLTTLEDPRASAIDSSPFTVTGFAGPFAAYALDLLRFPCGNRRAIALASPSSSIASLGTSLILSRATLRSTALPSATVSFRTVYDRSGTTFVGDTSTSLSVCIVGFVSKLQLINGSIF